MPMFSAHCSDSTPASAHLATLYRTCSTSCTKPIAPSYVPRFSSALFAAPAHRGIPAIRRAEGRQQRLGASLFIHVSHATYVRPT